MEIFVKLCVELLLAMCNNIFTITYKTLCRRKKYNPILFYICFSNANTINILLANNLKYTICQMKGSFKN